MYNDSRSNFYSNRFDQPKEDKFKAHTNLIKEINSGGKLAHILTIEKINLPDGYAYKIASEYMGKGQGEKLNTNQLRKYFQQIQSVVDLNSFNEKRNELFKVLPNIAYAAGRGVCPGQFYRLMEACISKNTLVDDEDIQAFVDFLTAIVAYYKFLLGGQK